MSEIISGKEALIALLEGKEVEYYKREWLDVNQLSVRDLTSLNSLYKFRLKPNTITINGIEIPKPFKPNVGEDYWFINTSHIGYGLNEFESDEYDGRFMQIGAWRTENEVKQVVEALRSVFKVD